MRCEWKNLIQTIERSVSQSNDDDGIRELLYSLTDCLSEWSYFLVLLLSSGPEWKSQIKNVWTNQQEIVWQKTEEREEDDGRRMEESKEEEQMTWSWCDSGFRYSSIDSCSISPSSILSCRSSPSMTDWMMVRRQQPIRWWWWCHKIKSVTSSLSIQWGLEFKSTPSNPFWYSDSPDSNLFSPTLQVIQYRCSR